MTSPGKSHYHNVYYLRRPRSIKLVRFLQTTMSQEAEMSLPDGFEDIDQIGNMSHERLSGGPLVNVFGIVTSYQPPIKTSGRDWKCTVEIKDISTQFNTYGMKVTFFVPLDQMPKVGGAGGEVLRLEQVKVQMRNGRIGLLTNWKTKYLVFPVSDLEKALSQPVMKVTLASQYQIRKDDVSYATWLYLRIKPDGSEFQEKTAQASVIKDKYSPLKDLEEDRYYNLLGEVVKKFEHGDKTTVYLSDYTANRRFYDYKSSDAARGASEDRDGDEYGYTSKFADSEEKDWPGPRGKLTIQLTLYDEHVASMMNFQPQQWVEIRNVKVRMGSNSCLEGRLHGGAGGIWLVTKTREADEIDPRYKDGLRRRRAYEEALKNEVREQKDAESNGGLKRKSDAKSKSKNKKLKKERWAAVEEKRAVAEKRSTNSEEEDRAETLVLNKYIKCSHPDQPALPLYTYLNPDIYEPKTEWGLESPPPFMNRKFRANVRVINFFPDKLEDFAVGRVTSDYDVLSDHSESEYSEDGQSLPHSGTGSRRSKEWSWQFALRVEDASLADDANPKKRVWLLVDNSNAECLLGLDAADLYQDNLLLQQLRRQLELLWGDLEERKSDLLKQLNQIESKQLTESKNNSTTNNNNDDTSRENENENALLSPYSSASTPLPKPTQSPQHKNQQSLTTLDPNLQPTSSLIKERLLTEWNRDPQVKNTPFTCCIMEYGVKNEATARIEDRKFAMFGTRIAGD